MAGRPNRVAGARPEDVARPIKSTVSWLVLGLLIEKPSYGYEVFKRFERRYDTLVNSRGTTRIYSALESLEEAGLVEPIDAPGISGTRRQPKVHYRATARGAAEWKRDLVERFEEESQRPAILSRVLAASALDDRMVLAVLDQLEHELLGQRESAAPEPLEDGGGETEFGVKLAGEYRRVVLHAQFMFVDWARAELKARADARRAAHVGDDDGPAVA